MRFGTQNSFVSIWRANKLRSLLISALLWAAIPGSLLYAQPAPQPCALPSPLSQEDQIRSFIIRTCLDMRVDCVQPLAIAWQESRYRPEVVREERDHSISSGVFQLNSVLLKTVGVEEPLDWRSNVIGGVGWWSHLLHRSKGDVRLARCMWFHGENSRGCR